MRKKLIIPGAVAAVLLAMFLWANLDYKTFELDMQAQDEWLLPLEARGGPLGVFGVYYAVLKIEADVTPPGGAGELTLFVWDESANEYRRAAGDGAYTLSFQAGSTVTIILPQKGAEHSYAIAVSGSAPRPERVKLKVNMLYY